MYILSQLFHELPCINQRTSRQDSEYRRLAALLEEAYEQFSAEFSEQGRAQFEIFSDADTSMTAIEAEDCFIEGFLLGARIMLAVTGEYRGQLKPNGEFDHADPVGTP